MKKIAILQSNYIPWKGYFDIISSVDEFILYDDMQFTKNDWRNRNQIKTPQGLQWLSVPVGTCINRKIREVCLADATWQAKHWKTLESNYRRSKYFNEVAVWLEPLYRNQTHTHLSHLNRFLIEAVCNYIGINTVISNSWDYKLTGGKTESLVNLCIQAGGTEYISGPKAKSYLDERIFESKNIKLTWFEYTGYPQYPQLWGEFIHGVTILDLLFNTGRDAGQFMKNLQQ
jgi:hypothetical protein